MEAILLGAVEGLTEFLPISSTGHLTIVEKALGYEIDASDITAFTAIIQIGAVLATVLYFRRDLVSDALRLSRRPGESRPSASAPSFASPSRSRSAHCRSPIVGLTFQDQIETTLRSLWVVGSALILWSAVMWFADRTATQRRGEDDVRARDTLIIGVTQCLALIPGVSRAGATMSAGLLRDFDRVTVTRLSFFLSIPALTAATILQAVTKFDDISNGVGWGPTLVAVAMSLRRRLRRRRLVAPLHRRPHLQHLHHLPRRARRSRCWLLVAIGSSRRDLTDVGRYANESSSTPAAVMAAPGSSKTRERDMSARSGAGRTARRTREDLVGGSLHAIARADGEKVEK